MLRVAGRMVLAREPITRWKRLAGVSSPSAALVEEAVAAESAGRAEPEVAKVCAKDRVAEVAAEAEAVAAAIGKMAAALVQGRRDPSRNGRVRARFTFWLRKTAKPN